MLRSTPLAALVMLAAMAPSCGGDETETVVPADENEPPVWSDAPEAASIGQGKSILLPVTVEDDAADVVTVTVAGVPDGLEVEVIVDDAGTQLALHASYMLSGPVSFDVVLDDTKDATTVSVALEVLPVRWLENPEWTEARGPEAREHGSMIVDSEAGQAFVFGGSGYSPYLEPFNDAWRYDVASGSWSEATVSGDVPPPAGSRRVAHVPGTNTAYLWGGYGGVEGSESFSDLYRVTVEGNGLVFDLLAQTNEPPARALHGFAYDPGSDRFALFGGAGSGLYDDTWIMTLDGDTAVWTEIDTDDAPKNRYGFFSGVDTERGRMIVFSGQVTQTTFADDTWALDMRAEPPAWELISEGGAAGEPPGRRNGCAVYDPAGERLFVFGGTSDGMTTEPGLFAFDVRPGKHAWTQLELDGQPDVRSSGFGFYDSTSDRTLLGFGNTATAVYRDWGVIGY